MATIGDVNVAINLDAATAALTCIREHARQVFAKDPSATAYGDGLCDVVRMVEEALAQCQAEQSENARLRAWMETCRSELTELRHKHAATLNDIHHLRTAIRELAASIRDWDCQHEFGVGMVYSGKITQEAVQELEAMANPEGWVAPVSCASAFDAQRSAEYAHRRQQAGEPAFAVGQCVEVHGIAPPGRQELNGLRGIVVDRWMDFGPGGKRYVWKYQLHRDGCDQGHDNSGYYLEEELRLVDDQQVAQLRNEREAYQSPDNPFMRYAMKVEGL